MLISNFVLLAKKQKIDAEIALSEFVKIVNNPRFVSREKESTIEVAI